MKNIKIALLQITLIFQISTLAQDINMLPPTQLDNGQTRYIREYTHQASKTQDEIASKKIVLRELTQDTLREAGIYIQSEVTREQKTDEKRQTNIKSTQLTAGILQVKILKKKWTVKKTSFWSEPEKTLYMKVAITLQKADVAKKIKKLVDYNRVNKKLTQVKKEVKKEIKAKTEAIEKLNLTKEEKALALAKLQQANKQTKQLLAKLENAKKQI